MADRWDSSLYDDRHSWVWKKVGDLIDLLSPQPGEKILDLGCGTGHLTAKIAERGAEVVGLDGSASMIAQARQNYPKLKFSLADARAFQCDEPFDGVFSNAALHWIPEASSVIARVAGCLKPGGRLILEMGGKGNIARIVRALTMAIEEAGYPARNPWYFPSAAEYSSLLEERNFEIEALWTIERWNKLEHPEKGLRELLEMFAGHWFEVVPAHARETIVGDIEARLRAELWRDGAWWADYRRLRIVARLGS
jgi:trans-aconitate methyltransferase